MIQRAGPDRRTFGMLLKTWRQLRRKSQLAVAVDASISARHLSFVESGRSVPSREMVQVLSDALDVPLRERNALLIAAGYAPLYPEHPLASSELTVVRNALDQLLRHQEPYPAVVLDRQWNIVQTNHAAPKFFGMFMDVSARPQPVNLLRSMFDPSGMRPWIANWPVVAETLVQRVFREAVAGVPDPEVLALLDELQSLPGVPTPRADSAAVSLPFHAVHFVKGAIDVRFFSMVTTVGAPFDVTAQELRIEAFFPCDDETEEFARRCLGG